MADGIKGLFLPMLCLILGGFMGQYSAKKSISKDLFANGSEKYLNGFKIDLPEEISQLSQMSDDSIEHGDNLYGVIDPVNKTIHISFDKTDYTNVFKEYQLDVDHKGFQLYDKQKLIGSGTWNGHSDNQLDSIILKDNQ